MTTPTKDSGIIEILKREQKARDESARKARASYYAGEKGRIR